MAGYERSRQIELENREKKHAARDRVRMYTNRVSRTTKIAVLHTGWVKFNGRRQSFRRDSAEGKSGWEVKGKIRRSGRKKGILQSS